MSAGLFQGDLIIKAAIELSIDDMRKNPWLIEDVFASLIENPILNKKYGIKEVNRAKEFILNNKIPVYMKNRLDKQDFPCITVSIGESYEDKDLSTLGDLSTCFEELNPCDIGKPISYIVKPFDVVSYDSTTGIVEVPENITEYKYISKGMVAVDPDTGGGFIVIEKAGTHGFRIASGSKLPGGQLAIIPQYPLYRARRERAISQETYHIGCHVEGDISTLIFLYSVVKYGLYRYREGLLESQNFQLSRIRSTDMVKNQSFSVENVYSRFIILQGQVEESWIKTPKRFIEGVDHVDNSGNSITAGIKILSAAAPDEYNTECDIWTTVDDKKK